MEIVGTGGQILMAKYPLPIPYPPRRLYLCLLLCGVINVAATIWIV